jgi:lysophospholipase L1-like esterase
MLNRRTFLRTGALYAEAVAASTVNEAQGAAANPSDVSGYDYRLPKLTKGSRMLFLGDSITDKKWGRNERDRNHYLGHSYVYLIASRLGVDMPEAQLKFFNRGISGHKVSDLKARWQKDAIDMNPDFLSILIGVNDVSRGGRLEQWESDYRFILDASRKAKSNLALVLLDPFVLRSGRLKNEDAWKKWRGKVDRYGAVVVQLSEDYGAVHVKTQEVFDAAAKAVSPEHWIWDGVHPLPHCLGGRIKNFLSLHMNCTIILG